ncbi:MULTISPECIES: hypothetical protein [unclassified Curtobacterium]|uniref:hypothetical protein n=1 Tax=unclassified Curtobacterium TaxID=257496 RepID=UPI000FAB4BAE|nr:MULTISPECIES: hypothetical protein [unclassified Curtobacterium]ROQ07348.1 hypothetical protein EDF41_1629 [Curtobacterium sp. PhB171]ROQ24040.1 hypothetical protein EDF40_2619 [Curtobacterium sp. PhB170]ROS35954.1 hypothetical protein EDF25_1796 [Curtobacterium sp. PhB131]ROS70063.1 hypothetical protein EDF30_1982 [Curtobacterium sp. PhB141]
MRFVLAIVSFVIGLLLVATAVGQRTVFAPPSSLVADSTTKSSAPVTVIPGSTLNANPGYQRINVSGSGKVFAAYGKTADVDAWVGDAEHTTLRFDAESAKLVGKTTGSEASVPSPKGSDLWYQEYDGSGQFTVRLPQDVSVLIVGDGKAAAPSDVSVTWPKDTATPSVGPLLVAGGVFALGGIVLLVLAFLHQRRGRGPRRRSGGTRPPRVRASRRAAAAGAQVPTRGRRGSRAFIAVPVVLVGTLALAGCSSDYWPQGGDPSLATPTPTASATGAAETTEPAAATKQQITRVVERIAAVADKADSARDTDLATTRFTGAALDLRTANYAIRGKDTEVKAPPAISAGQVCVALPQQTDTWPRTVFVIVAEDCDAKSAPQALTLVQDTARDPYKVAYDVSLEADAKIPSLAPTSIGAALLAPQSKLLAIAPDQVATAYGDILSKDSKSEYADLFATEGDGLRTTIGKAYKDKKAQSLPDTAKIEYSSEAPEDSAVAIATDDAGALVSADLNEIEKVTPTASGAEVNTEGAVKALSGVDTSKKGISATYGVQLLFYVPPVASDDKVVLLGFTQGLTAASEVQ